MIASPGRDERSGARLIKEFLSSRGGTQASGVTDFPALKRWAIFDQERLPIDRFPFQIRRMQT